MAATWEFHWNENAESAMIPTGYSCYVDQGPQTPMKHMGVVTEKRIKFELPRANINMRLVVVPMVGGREADPRYWQYFEFRANDVRDFDPPATPEEFTVSQDRQRLVFAWKPPTDPRITHHEIRTTSGWVMGRLVALVPVPLRQYSVGFETIGLQTFSIKAFSEQGLESAAPATATFNVRADAEYVRLGSKDESGDGFPGTLTNAEIVSSKLRPIAYPSDWASTTPPWNTINWDDAITGPWWFPHYSGAQYVSRALDAGSVVYGMPELELSAPGVSLAPNWDEVGAPWDEEFDADGNAVTMGAKKLEERIGQYGGWLEPNPMTVEIDTTPDDPAGSPTWDGFRPWMPGTEYKYRGFRFRFKWNETWPFHFPELATCKFHERRRNLKDEGKFNTTSAAGGDELVFAQPFTSAPSMSFAVEGINMTIEVVSITKTSCFVRVYNAAAATRATPTLHWTAKGT